ncbi:hypothetical protein [Sphingomonas gilva]|uniref:hypothetical protein n=1 Tax=Sphingomonas gilva TaxID=2305907 RepID=UPI0015FA3BB1|nr:hypothetical protein [Sphingomonas gilva]
MRKHQAGGGRPPVNDDIDLATVLDHERAGLVAEPAPGVGLKRLMRSVKAVRRDGA